tara:strand:- start:1607 stop:1894 length:288 start_codon:yes stop_codon:yes gene_type:complete
MNVKFKEGDLVRMVDPSSGDPFEAFEHLDDPTYVPQVDYLKGVGVVFRVHEPTELPPRFQDVDGNPLVEMSAPIYEVLFGGKLREVNWTLLEKVE